MSADQDELFTKIDHKRNKNREKKVLIADLKEQIRAKDMEGEREMKKKDRVEQELKDLKVQLEKRAKAAAQLTSTIKEGEAKNAKLETHLAAARKEMEKYLGDFESLYQNTRKLTEQLDDQVCVCVCVCVHLSFCLSVILSFYLCLSPSLLCFVFLFCCW